MQTPVQKFRALSFKHSYPARSPKRKLLKKEIKKFWNDVILDYKFNRYSNSPILAIVFAPAPITLSDSRRKQSQGLYRVVNPQSGQCLVVLGDTTNSLDLLVRIHLKHLKAGVKPKVQLMDKDQFMRYCRNGRTDTKYPIRTYVVESSEGIFAVYRTSRETLPVRVLIDAHSIYCVDTSIWLKTRSYKDITWETRYKEVHGSDKEVALCDLPVAETYRHEDHYPSTLVDVIKVDDFYCGVRVNGHKLSKLVRSGFHDKTT